MDKKISKEQLQHNLLYNEEEPEPMPDIQRTNSVKRFIDATQKISSEAASGALRGASDALKGATQSADFLNKTFTVFGDDTHDEIDDAGLMLGSEYDRTRYLVNHEKSSSKDFMDEVTYKVPVKDLYEVIRVCT